ncbi:MAG: Phosphate transport system permease protein PstA [Myxococcaceae bacterium]|nr:Phosphate transport system permease protein PstA [Myxococcaceae bacterium]MEA2750665.1 phosphate transport system permease protein [Myxococcales bacterium]
MSAELDTAYAGRKLAARAATAASCAAVAIALVPLLAILLYVAQRGLGALSVAFFTQLPRPVGEHGGGMANAIVGTLELVGLASLMGIPVGIAAGLFLAEYRAAPLARVVRFSADVLAGVPSIIVGVVVYATVVVRMHHFSTFAGAGALAILMLPLVARTTDELARTVPESLREAALALGASRWRIAIHVVLKTAAPGIRAGCMLAVARVCGETAPLLFTAFNNRFWNESFSDPTASLQVQIFTYSMSPYDDWHAQAWAAALVLVALVVVLNLAARRVLRGRQPA